MSGHTPGPWWVCNDEDEGRFLFVSSGTPGEICSFTPHSGSAGKNPTRIDNACLIAAAPDLLAALERLERGGYDRPASITEARAAIAKARGIS